MIKLDKILIIQTAFLGDVILSLPMVQTLKNHLPDSKIDFLCVPVNVSVISNHPAINSVIPYDKKGADKFDKFIEVLSEIRENEYDIVITPHRFLRSALLTYYSEGKTRIGFNRNTFSFLLTNKVKYAYDKHEILRNIDLVKAIPGINFDEAKISLKPELYPSSDDENIVNEILSGMNINKLITFAPCSRWVTKQFPLHKSVDLINLLISDGYNVALIGGNDDREYCRRVENRVINKNFIKLCGKLTAVQSYLVIKKSRLLVTVDSAAQHLGAATDTPLILIYGSTNSTFGFYPLIAKNKIIEQSELTCRPCTDHGRTKCPLGHFRCMEDIEPGRIMNEVKGLI
ncbi:MAG TPA: lipopolysaccharide heptosyltransferase II [Ignavibacteria bacterium]|nr:lipopolysaccharide heptosyltransferase II [Ignavibacteria bacterium]